MKKKRVKSFNELNQIAKNEIYDTFIHSCRSERRRILKDYRITLEGTYTGFYRKKNNTVVIPGKKLSAKVLKKCNKICMFAILIFEIT